MTKNEKPQFITEFPEFESGEQPLDVMQGRSIPRFAGDLLQNVGFVLVETSKIAGKGIAHSARKLGRGSLLAVGVAYSASEDAADLTRVVTAAIKKD